MTVFIYLLRWLSNIADRANFGKFSEGDLLEIQTFQAVLLESTNRGDISSQTRTDLWNLADIVREQIRKQVREVDA